MTEKPGGFVSRLKSVAQWVRIILLVVLITLLVILVLQNLSEKAAVVFIVPRWETSSAVLVAASFLSGVVVALLGVFLRRGGGK